MGDTERLGIVMEYWAYQSSRTVMPAYYEVVIKYRRVNDPDAHQMLDISGNITSSWQQNKKAIDTSIQNFYKKISELG